MNVRVRHVRLFRGPRRWNLRRLRLLRPNPSPVENFAASRNVADLPRALGVIVRAKIVGGVIANAKVAPSVTVAAKVVLRAKAALREETGLRAPLAVVRPEKDPKDGRLRDGRRRASRPAVRSARDPDISGRRYAVDEIDHCLGPRARDAH